MVPKDGEIRTRILSKLEQNPKISQQMIAEECERIENLRHAIEERDTSKINAIKQKPHKKLLIK